MLDRQGKGESRSDDDDESVTQKYFFDCLYELRFLSSGFVPTAAEYSGKPRARSWGSRMCNARRLGPFAGVGSHGQKSFNPKMKTKASMDWEENRTPSCDRGTRACLSGIKNRPPYHPSYDASCKGSGGSGFKPPFAAANYFWWGRQRCLRRNVESGNSPNARCATQMGSSRNFRN
jgi:hypothetical protein